jgi:hypothetical protein
MIQENKIIHHSINADILLSAYFVLGFFLSIYGCIIHPEQYGFVIATFCLLVLFITWLRLDYVEINSDGITRHYNYFLARNLSWMEISRVATIASKGQLKNKYSAIKISSNNPMRKEVIINIKILNKQDVQWIADMLVQRTNGDICDEAIKIIAKNWVA